MQLKRLPPLRLRLPLQNNLCSKDLQNRIGCVIDTAYSVLLERQPPLPISPIHPASLPLLRCSYFITIFAVACNYWKAAMKILPVILMILMLSVGCRRSAIQARLDESAAIMDSLPDSAFAILKSINPKDIGGKRLNAEYALFMSQAQYKNFIDVDDDSLISIASDYYREREPSRKKMLACFYDGIIKHRMGNYSAAIVAGLEAEDIALKLGDYYYLGMIYELLAKAYNCVYGNDDELKYSALALESYRKAGKNDHADFAALNLGVAYNNVGQYDRGLEMFDSIRFSGCKDSDVINSAMNHSLTSLMGLKNYQEIIRRCANEDSIGCAMQDARVLAFLAVACGETGNMDESDFYKDKSLELMGSDDTLAVYGRLCHLAAKNKNIKDFTYYHEKIDKIHDSLIDLIFKQQVYTAQRDYYHKRSKNAEDLAKRDRNRMTLVLVMLFSSCLIAMVVVIYRNKRRRLEYENALVSIRNERDNLMRDNSDATLQINELLRHRFDSVQSLCDCYFEQSGSNRDKGAIYKEVARIVDSFSSDEMLASLEATLNRCKGNIVTKLRQQVSLSSSELKLALYFMSGFTARSICCFMNVTPSNLYNQKSRLKKKIIESSPSDKQEFLNALGYCENNLSED